MNKFYRGTPFQRGAGGCFNRNQKGHGIGRFFKGSLYQNGAGLGNMWAKFIKWVGPIASKIKGYAMPILKSGSKIVGKEVVNAASDIANAVIDGSNFKDTATSRISMGVDNLIEKANEAAPNMSGHGGINTKKRKIFGSFNKKKSNKKPRVLDIFD